MMAAASSNIIDQLYQDNEKFYHSLSPAQRDTTPIVLLLVIPDGNLAVYSNGVDRSQVEQYRTDKSPVAKYPRTAQPLTVQLAELLPSVSSAIVLRGTEVRQFTISDLTS